MTLRIHIDKEQIASFCRRWKITELSFFGSVLRDDFNSGSDIDVLVDFEDEDEWSLVDHVAMERELGDLLGRKVDMITRWSVANSSNVIRQKAILKSLESVYVAG